MQSSSNTYENCYQANQGGVFSITSLVNPSTHFTETGSTYQWNQATTGGVIYCNLCTLSLVTGASPISFSNNYAQYGGVVYIVNAISTKITNVQFMTNQASIGGGVIACINTN